MSTLVNEPFNETFSNNPIIYKFNRPIPGPGLEPNFRLVLEVYVEDAYNSGTFVEIAKLYGRPNADGDMTFDLSNVVHTHLLDALSADDLVPTFTQSAPFILDTTRRMYVDYYDEYGNPVVQQSSTSSAERTVILGGVSEEKWKSDYLFFDGTPAYPYSRAVLNHYPTGKRVQMAQPDFIAIYAYATQTYSVDFIQYDAYNNSGTSSNAMSIAANKGQVVIFPCGPSQLTISADTKMYEIDLLVGGVSLLGYRKTHVIDRNYHECSLYLLYVNQYYTPQTIAMTGRKAAGLELDRSIGSQVGSSEPGNARTLRQFGVDISEVYTYRTGFLTKEEAEALQSLLTYSMLYEYREDNYVPLLLVGNNYKISECLKMLHTLEFSARKALKKKIYSDNPYVDVLDFWQEDNLDYWTELSEDFWEHP